MSERLHRAAGLALSVLSVWPFAGAVLYLYLFVRMIVEEPDAHVVSLIAGLVVVAVIALVGVGLLLSGARLRRGDRRGYLSGVPLLLLLVALNGITVVGG
ncbi:hypothetical protein [Actinoplanes sp. G11-F43]|uniref:hypothetical protein n=1 Tax=Actinoplanes sp. G11-F43 TaxID=3424130 RepID=UPI003D34B488